MFLSSCCWLSEEVSCFSFFIICCCFALLVSYFKALLLLLLFVRGAGTLQCVLKYQSLKGESHWGCDVLLVINWLI